MVCSGGAIKYQCGFLQRKKTEGKTEKTEKGKKMQNLCAGWAVDFCTIFLFFDGHGYVC